MGQRDVIAELRRRCMFPGGCEQPAKRERLCAEHWKVQAARFGLDAPSPRTKVTPVEPTQEPPGR